MSKIKDWAPNAIPTKTSDNLNAKLGISKSGRLNKIYTSLAIFEEMTSNLLPMKANSLSSLKVT